MGTVLKAKEKRGEKIKPFFTPSLDEYSEGNCDFKASPISVQGKIK
jgi:hypothetical protein